ncbi:MAG: alpha/beta hydrolase [Betaproteobacteria bacterium]|nr:alpha/beta hydrolase [Betaproteobacteria bacterium]
MDQAGYGGHAASGDGQRQTLLRDGAETCAATDTLPFSLERLAQDTVELIDHFKLDRAHIVGSSAGGFITQRTAMDFPERVQSVSLIGSKPGLKRSQASEWLEQVGKKGLRPFLKETIALRFPDEIDSEFVEWFLDEAAKNNVPFIGKFVGYMTTQDFMDEVHKIRCPALLIAPGAEPIGSIATYHEMKSKMPDAELIVYEGARHNINDYLPDRCVGDILTFLDKRFGGQLAANS